MRERKRKRERKREEERRRTFGQGATASLILRQGEYALHTERNITDVINGNRKILCHVSRSVVPSIFLFPFSASSGSVSREMELSLDAYTWTDESSSTSISDRRGCFIRLRSSSLFFSRPFPF